MVESLENRNKVVLSNMVSLSRSILDIVLGNEASDVINGEELTVKTKSALIASHIQSRLEVAAHAN